MSNYKIQQDTLLIVRECLREGWAKRLLIISFDSKVIDNWRHQESSHNFPIKEKLCMLIWLLGDMHQYLKASPGPFFMKESKSSTYLWMREERNVNKRRKKISTICKKEIGTKLSCFNYHIAEVISGVGILWWKFQQNLVIQSDIIWSPSNNPFCCRKCWQKISNDKEKLILQVKATIFDAKK